MIVWILNTLNFFDIGMPRVAWFSIIMHDSLVALKHSTRSPLFESEFCCLNCLFLPFHCRSFLSVTCRQWLFKHFFGLQFLIIFIFFLSLLCFLVLVQSLSADRGVCRCIPKRISFSRLVQLLTSETAWTAPATSLLSRAQGTCMSACVYVLACVRVCI